MSTTADMQDRNPRPRPTPRSTASVDRSTTYDIGSIVVMILIIILLWSLLNPIYALIMRYLFLDTTVYLDLTASFYRVLWLLALIVFLCELMRSGINLYMQPIEPVCARPATSNTQVAEDGHGRAKKEVVEPVVDHAPATHDQPVFPWKHFGATGDCFGRRDFSQPLFPEETPRSTYPPRDSYYDKVEEPTDAIGCPPTKDTKPTPKAKKVSFVDVVVAKPAHKAVEQPPQPAPAPVHTPVISTVTTSSSTEVIQAPMASTPAPAIAQAPPVPAPRPEIIQVGLPAVEPSFQDMQICMLELVAAQEFKMQNAMDLLHAAFLTNGAYKEHAVLILSMMEEAKTHLLPLFPEGLTGLNTDRLIWTNSLLTFWEALRPYGYEFKVCPNEDVRIFVTRYHDFTCWMGLGHLLRPFIFTEPPAPEPIQAPPPPPPTFPTQPPTPPLSLQAPSFPAPAVSKPVPEPIQAPPQTPVSFPSPSFSAQVPNPAPTPFAPSPPVSFKGLSFSTKAAPKPAPTPFAPIAPVSFQGLSFSTKTAPKPVPTPFAPSTPVSFQGLSFSTTPVPRPTPTPFAPTAPVSFQGLTFSTKAAPKPTPTPSAPPRAQPTPQPQTARNPPGLLNFDSFDWLDQSDAALNALTSESFKWSSRGQATYNLWSYSTMGKLRLSPIDPAFLNPTLVKAALNNVAPMFKRASVILHLQNTVCSPHEDTLSMMPLLGEMLALLEAAEKMTNDCQGAVVFDRNDAWYKACRYFGPSIISSGVIDRMTEYRDSMMEDVKTVWGNMKAQWANDTT